MNCPAAFVVVRRSSSTSRTHAPGIGSVVGSRTTPPTATTSSSDGTPTTPYSPKSVVTAAPASRSSYTTGRVTIRSTTGFQIVSILSQKSGSLANGSSGATTAGRGGSSISSGKPAGGVPGA